MSTYTPTTATIRAEYAGRVEAWEMTYAEQEAARAEEVVEFDRWLQCERDQQAKFWMRVEKGYHWLWTGTTATNGYGRVDVNGRNQAAHRVAYEWLVGPIPDSLELDHLCAVRNCVNPKHLEPVTHRENTLRGNTITAAQAARTHCPQGHELGGENLVPSSLRKGRRDCLTCSRQRASEYRARKKAGTDA